jgi:hypothetical protein
MAELQKMGLDFSDDRGQPLRCTQRMCRVAEAAVKGIKGKLPDMGSIGLVQWEEKLKQESENFLAKKRKGT